jgi:photosystem II stability/assembly factor-like uncharacterized protein
MRSTLGVPGFAAVTVLWACSSGSIGPASAQSGDGGASSGGSSGAGSSGSSGSSGSAGDDGATGGDDTGDDASGPAPVDAGLVQYDQVAPTPPASWAIVTGTLATKSSECGNVSAVFSDPHADRLIVGIALNGLFASTDGAQTWTSIGTSGDPIKNRMSVIAFDPTTAGTFWESGIYGWETQTAGVFVTTNGGTSFTGNTGLEAASNGNNTDDSVSIDFTDPQRKTMLAGAHETTGALYVSKDSGKTWTDIGSKLPSTVGFCTSTLVLDSSTLLVGCAASYSQKAGAILRSTDGGQSFASVHASGVQYQPLLASDGTIYFAAEGGGMVKSTDKGQTWSMAGASGATGSLRPFELPDGRIVSAANMDIVVSPDKGATWTKITTMPFAANGLIYSPFRRAFYASYFSCDATVPSDGIQRYGWDYE